MIKHQLVMPLCISGNGLLQCLKSTDLEDSDLTCFEHSMSLPYTSSSNPPVVSHDSELIPHDIPNCYSPLP